MKKKIFVLSTFTCIALATGIILSNLNSFSFLRKGAAEGEYVITLDKNDDLSIVNKNSSFIDRATEFDYVNVSSSSNGHVVINRSGYITNKTPISGAKSIIVKHKKVVPDDLNNQDEYGFGDLFVVMDSHPIDNPFSYSQDLIVEESSDGYEIIVPSGNKYFSFASFNTCDIESISIKYACGFDGYDVDNSDFTLNIVGTNDIHGQTLKNGNDYSGLEFASEKIRQLKQDYKYNLMLDQGDLYQGSLDSYKSNGHIMDDYLISSGYDSIVLGNHEWDYSYEGKNDNGIEDHNAYFENTPVSLLANNVLYHSQEVDWNITMQDKYGNDLRGCKLIERHGVQIGIIGMAGSYASSISADLIQGYSFAGDYSQLYERTKKASTALQELGADFIILQIHDGSNGSLMSCYDERLSNGYVDLVLESHTHSRYDYVDSYGVHHVQANGYLQNMYNITVDFEYNSTTNEWEHSVNNAYFHYANNLNTLPKNELMSSIYYWYSNRIFGYDNNKIVSTNADYYGYNDIRSLVALTEYEVIEEEYGDKYDVIYGGGYLNVRGAGQIEGGVVTYGDINNLLPFDNDIQLCSALWSEFRPRFVDKDSYIYYMPNRVEVIDNEYYLDGIKIKDTDRVYFAVNSYNTQYQVYSENPMTSYRVEENFTEKYFKYDRDIVADKLASLDTSSENKPTEVTITSSNVEVGIEQSIQIHANVDRGNSSLYYLTSNENIAVVDGLTGVVTGKNIGTCLIKAISLVDKNVYDSIEVEVVSNPVDTTNYGSIDNPITVSEAIEIYNTQCQNSGSVSTQPIYVEGYVVDGSREDMGSYVKQFYICDEYGYYATDEVKLYVYSASYGGELDSSYPYINDKVVLYGYLKNYDGVREMASNNGQHVKIVKHDVAISEIIVNKDSSTEVVVTSGFDGETGYFGAAVYNGSIISFEITNSKDMSNNVVYVDGTQIYPNSSGEYEFTINGHCVININTSFGNGTLEDPYPVSTVIHTSHYLLNRMYLTNRFYMYGEIKQIRYKPNSTYPTYDLILTDDNGNEVYVDAIYNVDGANFPAGDTTLQVGQTIVFTGQIARDVSFLEAGYVEWVARECWLVSIS